MGNVSRHGVSTTSRWGRVTRLARFGSTTLTSHLIGRVLGLVSSGEMKARLELQQRQRMADELAVMLGEMKGLAMKAAQQTSYRSPNRDDPTTEAFGRLLQEAPPMDPRAVAAVVGADFGSPPEKLFAEWDPEPLGSASIGQVHGAVTHDGRHVAVKVQYPGAPEALKADMDNLAMVVGMIAKRAASVEARSSEELSVTLERFKARLVQETDYEREAADQETLAGFFADHPFIHVPAVVRAYSSTHVLTTDLCEGSRFDEVLAWDQEQRDLAGEAIFRFHHRCVFNVGMHSADPHPGNYIFRPDGRVSFIDFGAVWHAEEPFLAAVRRLSDVLQQPGVITEHPTGNDGIDLGGGRVANASMLMWLIDQVGCHGCRELPFPSGMAPITQASVRCVDLAEDDVERARVLGRSSSSDAMLAVQAVVATLGARAPWDLIAGEIWPWVGQGPSTKLGALEAEWVSAKG